MTTRHLFHEARPGGAEGTGIRRPKPRAALLPAMLLALVPLQPLAAEAAEAGAAEAAPDTAANETAPPPRAGDDARAPAEAGTAEATAADAGQAPPGAEGHKQDAAQGPAAIFIPTEEISEDFAVSLPVDI